MRRGIAASVALVSVGMFSLAACGGGGSGNLASQSVTTTTGGSNGTGQDQSGSGGASGSGGSSSSGSSNGSNGNSPNGKAKPTFTSAAVSPGLVTCAKLGDPKDVTVSWATKNATQVTVKSPGATGEYFPLAASGSVARTGACKGGALTWNITATGPGGSTTTSASANYTVIATVAPGGKSPAGSSGSGGSGGASTGSGGGSKNPTGQ